MGRAAGDSSLQLWMAGWTPAQCCFPVSESAHENKKIEVREEELCCFLVSESAYETTKLV